MAEPRSWEEFMAALAKLLAAKIGSTGDTGGSQTAGTVFAKENAILSVLKNGGMPVVKSMQRGYFYLSENPATIRISKVNINKSLLLVNFSQYGSGSGSVENFTEDSITLKWKGGIQIDTYWQVIEFY